VIWDKKLQEQVKNIPLNRLFLETDNDTNYTIQNVYQKVALIKNISLQVLKDQVYINTKNTFQKWEIG
jgi:TatD DNase family protein